MTSPDRISLLIQAIQDPEVQDFMKVHALDDAPSLVMRYSGKTSFDIGSIAQQIQLRRKALDKLGNFIKPFTVLLPKLYEQSTNETVAEFKAGLLQGETLLDATAGLGIDTFFAGNQFKQVTCLELDPTHARILKHNYNQLGFHPNILNTSLEDFLQQNHQVFDVMYIDPDRRPGSHGKRESDLKNCSPDILNLKPLLFQHAREVRIKLSPMEDIRALVEAFPGMVTEIMCIASQQEMKEILLVLKPDASSIRITAVHLDKNTARVYSKPFPLGAVPEIAQPLTYLFEPHPDLVKSRLGMALALENHYKLLYPGGFFYTGDHPMPTGYGRCLQIREAMPYKKNLLQAFLKSNHIEQAHITCRNFFWKPEEVRHQLRIGDGGQWYLFCYTDRAKQPMAVWCQYTPEA